MLSWELVGTNFCDWWEVGGSMDEGTEQGGEESHLNLGRGAGRTLGYKLERFPPPPPSLWGEGQDNPGGAAV